MCAFWRENLRFLCVLQSIEIEYFTLNNRRIYREYKANENAYFARMRGDPFYLILFQSHAAMRRVRAVRGWRQALERHSVQCKTSMRRGGKMKRKAGGFVRQRRKAAADPSTPLRSAQEDSSAGMQFFAVGSVSGAAAMHRHGQCGLPGAARYCWGW
jgi:hypothetical protein